LTYFKFSITFFAIFIFRYELTAKRVNFYVGHSFSACSVSMRDSG